MNGTTITAWWRTRTIGLLAALVAAVAAVLFATRWAPSPPIETEPVAPTPPSARVPIRDPGDSSWMPIQVELSADIVPDDPHQHYPMDPYAQVSWHALAADHLAVEMGLTTGYCGTGFELKLYPATQSARIRVFEHMDFDPGTLYWSDVTANVKLSTWNLSPDTLIDVKVEGQLEDGPQALHLRSTLQNRRPRTY